MSKIVQPPIATIKMVVWVEKIILRCEILVLALKLVEMRTKLSKYEPILPLKTRKKLPFVNVRLVQKCLHLSKAKILAPQKRIS